MEMLFKKRKAIRASFTRVFNNLVKELSEQELNNKFIETKFATLERLSNELKIVDEEVVFEEGMTDEQCEQEYSVCEEYKEKMDLARVEIEIYRSSLNIPIQNAESLCSSPNSKTKLKLPRIELKKFGGEIKDWLGFWSQFKRIHEDQQMEVEDKFQYLIQATVMGTRAREIVDSFPPTAKNYEKVIESLRNRFGREELLIEFYVRELLGLVLRNATERRDKINTAQLYDKLESHLRALESIGMTSDKYAAMLFPLVESCIPEEILRVWLRNHAAIISSNDQEDTYIRKLKQLLLFLKSEVEGEERIILAKAGFRILESNPRREKKIPFQNFVPTANDLFSGDKRIQRQNCIFCERSHESKDCFSVSKMTASQKLDTIKKKNCCFTCLKTGHFSKQCKTNVRCLICTKRHWTIMCPELEVKKKRNEVSEPKDIEKSDATLSNFCCKGEVLLQTLMVNLEENGRNRKVRALIDTGSQRSYILKKTVEEMGCKPINSEFLAHTLFGGVTTKGENHRRYVVCLNSLTTDYSCKIPVLNKSVICGSIARLKSGPWMEDIKQKGIELTDVGGSQPPIEILIGSDVAGKLLTGNLHKLNNGLVAIETLLGWVIMGKMQEETYNCTHSTVLTTLLTHTGNIEDLWKLDAIGITDPCEVKSKDEMDRAISEYFEKTLKVDLEGRYEVSLPWLENREDLPSNRSIAERRLASATTKLKNEMRYNEYDSVFQDWEKTGVIEEVPENEIENIGHYLPHRGVFKENTTTAVRPVFDASCKLKGFPSLNDCLAKGPNLLELIPTVLLRFRKDRIGVTSDIKRAFLQISVIDTDRDFLRFLWWKDHEKKEIKIFRHRRVTFGLNCSPFLLGAVIDHHLKKYQPSVKNVAEKLISSFYVDNCVTSVQSKKELDCFVKESTQLMAKGNFELRGWEHTEFDNIEGKHKVSRVLGLLWDRQKDVLYCDLSGISKPEGSVTRRNILSITQKVFDPIGFCCPVTLIPKLLLQESWRTKLSWDSEVPEDICRKFLKWIEELHMISLVMIPRCVMLNDCHTFSLHVFSDACKTSYAAVIYLRSEIEQHISVQLLQAKSRVAPLKEVTIPRLELLACSVGTRLAAFVKKSLGIEHVKEYFWTDSSTALSWIKTDDLWGIFVRNRVKEIRKLSNVEDWRHIPGQANPADLPSRGCSATKLLESRWWEGPAWLKLPENEWPKSTSVINEEEVHSERKKCDVASLSCMSHENTWFLTYFSRYTNILRMVGWMLRFITNTRRRQCDRERGELSVSELNESERTLIKIVQREAFSSRDISSLKSLRVFRDRQDILRVKTKLTERKDEENFIYPILLPNDHKIVELLIQEQHLNMFHAGLHILLSRLRENFWILKARRTIRRIISKCIRCRRHDAKNLQEPPVTLPADRVRDASIFEVTGVDLAGPLMLKENKKSWIILFTCAVYRAIHLELIMSLSTKGFLLGLRRFIARRGRPKIVYSDNGTNFVGADNLFRAIDWKMIDVDASLKRIQWRFNPPTAAWWGGFWERLIQIVKKLLRRVLGHASLCYEEMMSVLCDCEAIVNSRPLTYVSEDAEDLVPLTPSMFLQDITTIGVPDLDHLEEVDLERRLRYRQRLRETLRARFRSEYLSQLIQRPGRPERSRDIKVGDVVLIETEGKKRTFWPMAKITEVYPGKDKCIRVVRLRTSKGEMVRPIQRIFPLEISSPVTLLMKGKCTSHEISPNSAPLPKGTVTTRSGRQIKPPSRF